MKRDGPSIIQTLRIEPRKLASMLEDLRQEESISTPEQGPENDRVWLNKKILVNFKGKYSSANQYEAHVRNISATGMSFVLGVYTYPDTPCTITIHTYSGEQQCLSGTVVRCRHLMGMIHEIGARFDSEIELDEFIDQSSRSLDGNSSADLSRATGTVLVIEDNVHDQRLLQHTLSDSKLDFTIVSDGASAIEHIADYPALIICDQNLPDTNGISLIKQIRKEGYGGQIVMVTGEEGEAVRHSAMQAGAMGIVTKPWTPTELKSMVAQALEQANDSPLHGSMPIVSTADTTQIPAEFVTQFVEGLAEIGDAIESSIEPLNRETLRARAMSVKSSALGYGFAPLTHAASKVLRDIDEKEENGKIIEDARTLLSTCRRAKVPDEWNKAA